MSDKEIGVYHIVLFPFKPNVDDGVTGRRLAFMCEHTGRWKADEVTEDKIAYLHGMYPLYSSPAFVWVISATRCAKHDFCYVVSDYTMSAVMSWNPFPSTAFELRMKDLVQIAIRFEITGDIPTSEECTKWLVSGDPTLFQSITNQKQVSKRLERLGFPSTICYSILDGVDICSGTFKLAEKMRYNGQNVYRLRFILNTIDERLKRLKIFDFTLEENSLSVFCNNHLIIGTQEMAHLISTFQEGSMLSALYYLKKIYEGNTLFEESYTETAEHLKKCGLKIINLSDHTSTLLELRKLADIKMPLKRMLDVVNFSHDNDIALKSETGKFDVVIDGREFRLPKIAREKSVCVTYGHTLPASKMNAVMCLSMLNPITIFWDNCVSMPWSPANVTVRLVDYRSVITFDLFKELFINTITSTFLYFRRMPRISIGMKQADIKKLDVLGQCTVVLDADTLSEEAMLHLVSLPRIGILYLIGDAFSFPHTMDGNLPCGNPFTDLITKNTIKTWLAPRTELEHSFQFMLLESCRQGEMGQVLTRVCLLEKYNELEQAKAEDGVVRKRRKVQGGWLSLALEYSSISVSMNHEYKYGVGIIDGTRKELCSLLSSSNVCVCSVGECLPETVAFASRNLVRSSNRDLMIAVRKSDGRVEFEPQKEAMLRLSFSRSPCEGESTFAPNVLDVDVPFDKYGVLVIDLDDQNHETWKDRVLFGMYKMAYLSKRNCFFVVPMTKKYTQGVSLYKLFYSMFSLDDTNYTPKPYLSTFFRRNLELGGFPLDG